MRYDTLERSVLKCRIIERIIHGKINDVAVPESVSAKTPNLQFLRFHIVQFIKWRLYCLLVALIHLSSFHNWQGWTAHFQADCSASKSMLTKFSLVAPWWCLVYNSHPKQPDACCYMTAILQCFTVQPIAILYDWPNFLLTKGLETSLRHLYYDIALPADRRGVCTPKRVLTAPKSGMPLPRYKFPYLSQRKFLWSNSTEQWCSMHEESEAPKKC